MKQMTDAEHKKAAKQFVEFWQGKGYEKGQSQPFWLSLLRDVFGVEQPEQFIEFEDKVKLTHDSFIDGMIPATKVLIEQKSLEKDLSKPIKQSDGTKLTPFQQAKRYISELPLSQHPRYVITCNFAQFRVYDMEQPNGEPAVIELADLSKEYYRLQFIADTGNVHLKKELEVSIKAGELVGKLYDALHGQYIEPDSEQAMKSLNVLCVRLVFCLYAEDAGIFGEHAMFHDYLASFRNKNMRRALIDLFRVLDQKPEERDPYMDEDLAAFPYVNGGLFADEDIEIPKITDDIIEILLKECSEDFDWSSISPTIFGAVFESTLNPETRRSGGMHYTSIENIHKVIDPLFLDDLKKEFQTIREIKVKKTRNERLRAFQDTLASLRFLDPACGSGNFLTETYLSLRRIENEIISLINEGSMVLGGLDNPIKISISQFYGIEINDFAVTVAKTALWIAESQMMKETEDIVHLHLDFLPLTTNAFIVEGNALRFDWKELIAPDKLSYIMGNPPFIATSGRVSQKLSSSKGMLSNDQKQDKLRILGKGSGMIDYVACWHKIAADYMKGTSIKTAFVSTNSICQGQQVAPLWKQLLSEGLEIFFAYQSFKWNSESSNVATVFVVIIGITYVHVKEKYLFNNNQKKIVKHINPYLFDAPDFYVGIRKKPLCCNAPIMIYGNKPADHGELIISNEEYDDFIKKEPSSKKYIKQFLGAREFINGTDRYCLWLLNASPKELKSMPEILRRIDSVRKYRLNSTKLATKKCADTPTLFQEIRQTADVDHYIAIPEISSGNRRYVPMGYLDSNTIISNKLQFIPNATLFHFGVLTSDVHMAWMRAVCGYYGPSYDYSANIVYNNFPWPTPTDAQRAKIETTAQAILDARADYPDASLADLYDELTMPPELRKAHQENDKAVMEAYGFDWRHMSESDCVAALMKLYQQLVTANS